MSESVEELQKKIAVLENKLLSYQQNGVVGLYYELNRFLNNTVVYMRSHSVQTIISGDKEDPKKFERTMALIKSAKEHVLDLEEIKVKFKLTGNEEADKERLPFIETIAKERT